LKDFVIKSYVKLSHVHVPTILLVRIWVKREIQPAELAGAIPCKWMERGSKAVMIR
jgi:hypothetical protein